VNWGINALGGHMPKTKKIDLSTIKPEEKLKYEELQKKVDELAYELAKKSIASEGINVTNTDISLCVHEKLLEQAVKDAVKEFATELLETKMKIANEYYIFADNIRVIAKQKGVEVE
jgi:2C-methyl-D-erythritol 2,4-cyclodiphosphate synthase